MGTSEFHHYYGHMPGSDPDNCGGCALTTPTMIDGQMGINYAGWPLAYMDNGRRIPKAFMPYLKDELERLDNPAYLANLRKHLIEHGYDIAEIENGTYE
jgi:hypothetical protein